MMFIYCKIKDIEVLFRLPTLKPQRYVGLLYQLCENTMAAACGLFHIETFSCSILYFLLFYLYTMLQ